MQATVNDSLKRDLESLSEKYERLAQKEEKRKKEKKKAVKETKAPPPSQPKVPLQQIPQYQPPVAFPQPVPPQYRPSQPVIQRQLPPGQYRRPGISISQF
jgi:hypothetical protein